MEPRWLQLLCLSLVVVRCQPLRRALYILRFIHVYSF
ncbi:superoxide dismutase [Vibrio cholerae]|nr:superoxide dismutase [Vibrio cholerae]